MHGVGALSVVGVAVDKERVSVVPENLISEALAETPLQLDLYTVVPAVAGGRI